MERTGAPSAGRTPGAVVRHDLAFGSDCFPSHAEPRPFDHFGPSAQQSCPGTGQASAWSPSASTTWPHPGFGPHRCGLRGRGSRRRRRNARSMACGVMVVLG